MTEPRYRLRNSEKNLTSIIAGVEVFSATQWHFVAGAGLEPASSGFQSFVRRLVVAAEYSKVLASLRWCAFQRLAFRRFASVTRNAVTRHHDLSQAA